MKKFLFLTFTTCLIFVTELHATFSFNCGEYSGAGITEGESIEFTVTRELKNTGTIKGNDVNISCGSLTGNGTISGKTIIIKTDEFKFTGTINCSKECLIISKKTFNKKMFKQTGKGKFTISVDENLQLPEIMNFNPWAQSLPAWENPLPGWWQEIAKKNISDKFKICRVYIQFAVEEDKRTSDEWLKILDVAKEIKKAFDHPWIYADVFYNESKLIKKFEDLYTSFPFAALEQGQLKGISCRSSVKTINPTEINDSLDLNVEQADLTFAIFSIYDSSNDRLNALFEQIDIPAEKAVALYFSGIKLGHTEAEFFYKFW